MTKLGQNLQIFVQRAFLAPYFKEWPLQKNDAVCKNVLCIVPYARLMHALCTPCTRLVHALYTPYAHLMHVL